MCVRRDWSDEKTLKTNTEKRGGKSCAGHARDESVVLVSKRGEERRGEEGNEKEEKEAVVWREVDQSERDKVSRAAWSGDRAYIPMSVAVVCL